MTASIMLWLPSLNAPYPIVNIIKITDSIQSTTCKYLLLQIWLICCVQWSFPQPLTCSLPSRLKGPNIPFPRSPWGTLAHAQSLQGRPSLYPLSPGTQVEHCIEDFLPQGDLLDAYGHIQHLLVFLGSGGNLFIIYKFYFPIENNRHSC